MDFHNNDLFEVVRDTTEDLVEEVRSPDRIDIVSRASKPRKRINEEVSENLSYMQTHDPNLPLV